jgi:hypothetical protein
MYLSCLSKSASASLQCSLRSHASAYSRYILRYLIRRLIRYAKYAAIGGVAALVGGTVLGTMGSGLAFFAAPGILGGMGLGLVGGVARVCPLLLLLGHTHAPRARHAYLGQTSVSISASPSRTYLSWNDLC